MKYAEIYNKATGKLLDARAEGYQGSNVQDMMLRGAIMGNTLLNTSTGHIAEMMIQGSNRGLTDMWKTINHNENAGSASLEIAKELQNLYTSWDELAESYRNGANYWSEDDPEDPNSATAARRQVYETLRDGENSPYSLAWNTTLEKTWE